MKKKSKDRILVVDDDDRLRITLSSILKENNFAVFTAANGREAHDLINNSALDAVILDLKLPDMDGITVLKMINRQKPGLPVIILTSHGTIPKAVAAIQIGAYDFFEKPVPFKKILISLANSLKSSRLEKERTFLIQDAMSQYKMIGKSDRMRKVFEMIDKVAASGSKVLISGENGTGKELVARAIHLQSERAGTPMVTVNCAALPHDLLESELFGHEKGAFTGAFQKKTGKFELASGSTLFLDEIGEMELRIQPKVLRAIESGEIQPLGGKKCINVDVRVIAATNRNLQSAVQKKEFREDLFFRLNVIRIHVPPLRERQKDIPLLAEYFLNDLCEQRNRSPIQLSPGAVEKLFDYSWPGNVRELRNLMEKIAVLSVSDIISSEEIGIHLSETQVVSHSGVQNTSRGTLADIRRNEEKAAIEFSLSVYGWNYKKTAKDLDISRSTLFSKIKEYGIIRYP